jgi:hypothetical protein
MKYKSYLFAAALSMAGGIAQGQNNHLVITENGESPTPVVTYNGSAVTLDPASTLFLDNWTIVLPGTFALNNLGQFLLGEPENAALVNDILVGTQPTTLTWLSDTAAPGGVAGPFLDPIVIPNGGTFTTASGAQETFDLTLIDQAGNQVPDASSTATLLGLALLGVRGAARFRNFRN